MEKVWIVLDEDCSGVEGFEGVYATKDAAVMGVLTALRKQWGDQIEFNALTPTADGEYEVDFVDPDEDDALFGQRIIREVRINS